jgi:gas vesicle protein
MDKFLKSLLNVANYVLDLSSDQVDRVSGQVSDLTARGKKAIFPEEDHTVARILTFAAGVGVGIAAGVLLAPMSGDAMRSSINEKVQNIGDKVRDRFSTDRDVANTGTDMP